MTKIFKWLKDNYNKDLFNYYEELEERDED